MKKMLTAQEVSGRTGLAVQTLAKRRVSGDSPPFIKLGSRVVYPEDLLEKWLAKFPRQVKTAETERPEAA